MAQSTPTERRLKASMAAHYSWANCHDRTARTAKARAGLNQKFLDQAGGDPVKAEHLRKAHFKRLALKSAQKRRKIDTLTAEVKQLEAELAGGDAA
jgi:hypothetical protein